MSQRHLGPRNNSSISVATDYIVHDFSYLRQNPSTISHTCGMQGTTSALLKRLLCGTLRLLQLFDQTFHFLNFDIKDRGRALPHGVIIHNCSKAHDQISRLAHACRDATRSKHPEAAKNQSHHKDLANTSLQKSGGLTAIVPCCLPCIRSQQLREAYSTRNIAHAQDRKTIFDVPVLLHSTMAARSRHLDLEHLCTLYNFYDFARRPRHISGHQSFSCAAA